MTSQDPVDSTFADRPEITISSEDGRTLTFRPEAVLAILTKPEQGYSTVLLQGGITLDIKGTGHALKRRVFGAPPDEVNAAVSQQAARHWQQIRLRSMTAQRQPRRPHDFSEPSSRAHTSSTQG